LAAAVSSATRLSTTYTSAGSSPPCCLSAQHGAAVVGYSSFGQGRFPAAQSSGGRVLQAIADERGPTPRQVALRFIVRRPSLLTIPTAVNADHAVENAGAGAFELTDDDVAAIDRAFPRRRRPREPPTL
jgi:diketogulonate reductase-like aldo/keto reductase